jgi:sugar-specific transcriptional regulator TrmB
MSTTSADYLLPLGFNKNEARALDALISLGPAGATDVHKYSGMPRNKAYESLERLAGRGMIEIQQGRPTIYRAISARSLINNLAEDYSKVAKEALALLERKQEDAREGTDADLQKASAWVVRGELGVKRRLAELIYNAKFDVFLTGGYPPKYPLAVKSALKAARKRGIKVRAVSIIRSFEYPEVSSDDSLVVEFRTIKTSLKQKVEAYDQRLIEGYRSFSGNGCMAIVDDATAFDIVDDGRDPFKITGIVFRALGIPGIQKATVERVLGLYTRKIRPELYAH